MSTATILVHSKTGLATLGCLLFVVVLTACTGQTPTAQPTPTSPLPEVTALPSATPGFDSTPLVLAITRTTAPTLAPSQTPRPTLPPTSTLSAENLNLRATLQAAQASCEGGVSTGDTPLFSPNGQWIAVLCSIQGTPHTFTQVSRLDGTQRWSVPFHETYGAAQQGDEPLLGVLRIFHWSNDGRYLYLVPWIRGMDGPGLLFLDGFALYRLDLVNGRLTTTFPPVFSKALYSGYVFSFSPNDRYLAYVNPLDRTAVRIYTLTTGFEQVIRLENVVQEPLEDSGLFLWSPDSKKLAFAAAAENWASLDGKSGFSLFLYDLEDNSLKTLLANDPRQFRPVEWVAENVILLNGYDADDRHDLWQSLDILSGELLPASTPTPEP